MVWHVACSSGNIYSHILFGIMTGSCPYTVKKVTATACCMPCQKVFAHPSTHQVTLGGLDGGLVIGCGEGGYKYFPSGYLLLECNLTGFVSCSDLLVTLVRLHFVRLRVAA